MGISKAQRERKQISRRTWAKQAANGQAPHVYNSNSKVAPVDMRMQRDEARQQLQVERERNAQQQQQMDEQAQEHVQLLQQVEEQQVEVQQSLQGQRELVERLEEEVRELEARSREQEQAMVELRESKALVVVELQAQLEQLRKELLGVAPHKLGGSEGEQHVMARVKEFTVAEVDAEDFDVVVPWGWDVIVRNRVGGAIILLYRGNKSGRGLSVEQQTQEVNKLKEVVSVWRGKAMKRSTDGSSSAAMTHQKQNPRGCLKPNQMVSFGLRAPRGSTQAWATVGW